jgi:hypothetical protein
VLVLGSEPVTLARATLLFAEQSDLAIEISRRLDSAEFFDDL